LVEEWLVVVVATMAAVIGFLIRGELAHRKAKK
jgi:hypothetical protein